jgi:hypothetical protein
MIEEFFESDKNSKDFIEDTVISSVIPGRMERPLKKEEEPNLVNIDKTP